MASTPRHDRSDLVPAFLQGGGETGALMRRTDWSKTPLGPVEGWESSLKTTVAMLLGSRHPMFLWWGPELVQFYNDAYLPSFGKGKHPVAMGQRGADCWQEIWPIIWPQIDDVMSRGKASWNEDHLVPIWRNDRIEEVYWTYGYSPVRDDDGQIGGTLVVCTETTNRVIAGRRLQCMRALAEATALADAPAGIMHAVRGVLDGARRDFAFVLFYEVDPTEDRPRLEATLGLEDDAARRLDEAFGSDLPAMAREVDRPLPSPLTAVGMPWEEPVEYVAVVAVGDSAAPVGFLLVGLSPRLPFDAAYQDYLAQVGQHIGHARRHIEAFHLRAVVESERNNLLEQAPVATALLTGPDHVFQLANPQYLNLVRRRDLVGRSFRSAFPELEGTPFARAFDQVYESGEPFVTSEMPVRFNQDGEDCRDACYVRFNLEPMRTQRGEVYGMMAVAVDVTPQVLARLSLEKAHAEREILLRELESANKAKDEFLARLGHELRNPLAPIVTALELLRRREGPEESRELEIISRQVAHVVSLVDDLLDVSRIARGVIELRRERVTLSSVVARAIEQASPLIEHRNHHLTVDVPSTLQVEGDESRLSQVVANVLTNAARYTDPGGEIEILAERDGDEAVLYVTDTGIGIADEMAPHVFDAFSQERVSDRSRGGLGLGLAIVKSLVDAHGGTVSLSSEGRARGTECMIRLPLASGPPEPAKDSGQPDQVLLTGHGMRVLLVDDNEDAAEMLGQLLRKAGHEVFVAFDVSAALELAVTFVPDVALLDLELPVLDGYELARRLRELPGWEQVRLVAVTGYGQSRDKEQTKHAGFDEHFTKPVDVAELDAAIRRLGAR